MNCTITLPQTDLSLMEWMIKHKVSSNLTSSEFAIARAINWDSDEL
jgi:hypothetical protein